MSINYDVAQPFNNPRLALGMAMLEYMFSQDKLIAQILAPYLGTPVKAANFAQEKLDSLLRDEAKKRGPGGTYARGTQDYRDLNFNCEEFGFEATLDDGLRQFYANDFAADLAITKNAFWKVLLAFEKRVRDLYQDTATFTTGNGLRTDVGADWANPNTDIIADVVNAIEAVEARTGMTPNLMWVGPQQARYLVLNDAIRELLQHTQTPTIETIRANLPALFGIEQLVIGKQVENVAAEGAATPDIQRIFRTHFAGVAIVPGLGADIMAPATARTWLWTSDTPEAVMVESYREEKRRSDVFRARAHTDEAMHNPRFAQLLDVRAGNEP